MTILASTVVDSALTTLQDPSYTRWTQAELVRYFNDGVKALIMLRPDTCAMKSTITPVAGARQQLPDAAISLIDILGNASGSQGGISKVDIHVLTASSRDWQSGTQSATALHYMYDLTDPRTYYLYPPSNGSGSIDLVHSYFPTDATYATSVPLVANWTNTLTKYVLARAYAKDAEFGGVQSLAASYMADFEADASKQLTSAASTGPKV